MPRQVYKKKNGDRVVGVTTAINACTAKPQLIQWGWRLGKEGKDVNVERKNAADAGTATHAMIEAHIGGKPEMEVLHAGSHVKLTLSMADRMDSCYATYLHWRESNEVEPIETELSLVSEMYGYGGTMDLHGRINYGPPCVADWKTSGKAPRLYPEVIVQLAAYRQLLEENGYDVVGEAHAICFGIDTHDHRTWSAIELDDAFALFIIYLEAYKLRKIVDKQV